MTIKKLSLIVLSIAFIFTSCSSDDDAGTPEPLGNYENGIFVLHEGNFFGGNASVSYISNDFQTVENNVFSSVNLTSLGDTAQSITFNGNLAYIILNVSNTIEVVNRYTFESVATITGFSSPRYMAISNGKGYVSNWGLNTSSEDDYVAIVDLSTYSIIDTISSSYLPNEVIAVGDKVYIATGIYGNGNELNVINTQTDELEDNITVGNSPDSFQLDSDGDLWVLSSENLIEIDTDTDLILQTIDLGSSITFPSDLNFDNGNFYVYAGGSVYKMSETATTFPTASEISGVNFYGMSVRNGFLYGLDAGDFASNGELKVYDLSTNSQSQLFTLNIIPSAVYFN